MTYVRVLALSLLTIFVSSAAGYCQSGKAPAGSVNWSLAPVDKPLPKKKAGQPSVVAAPESDKASRLEEGRKKFFGQSSGFDNSTMWDKSGMNVGAGTSGSAKPAVGFGF